MTTDEIREKPTEFPVSPLPPSNDPFVALMGDPEVRAAIAHAIDVSVQSMSGTARATGITRYLALIWSAVVIVSILGVVCFLAATNKLTGDAAAFVIGTMLGASFTFVREIFPKN